MRAAAVRSAPRRRRNVSPPRRTESPSGTADKGDEMIVLQSNDARGNELIAFTRELEPAWRAATGGRGTGTPHLPSQGSIATDGERLLVANAGSDDVSLFSTAGELLVLAPAGGERPVSIALRGDRAFVLNAGTASINGLTVGTRSLDQLPRSLYALPDGADPAQIAFAP